jgi:hypothetical protein
VPQEKEFYLRHPESRTGCEPIVSPKKISQLLEYVAKNAALREQVSQLQTQLADLKRMHSPLHQLVFELHLGDGQQPAAFHIVNEAADFYVLQKQWRVLDSRNIITYRVFKVLEWKKVDMFSVGIQFLL